MIRRFTGTRVRPAVIASVFSMLTLCPPSLHAGDYGTELPFTAGTGGRVSALGLAGSSLGGRPSLQHFNPASLSGLQYKEFEFYRTTFFDSKSSYHTVHYAHPMLNYGTLGISVLRLDVGGIQERDENNILISDNLKNAQTRLLLGYAASLHSALTAGINLKVDNQSFGPYSGSGIGADIGFLATRKFSDDSRLRYLRGGLSILNLIEPSVKLDQEDVADPLAVVIGVSGAVYAGDIGFVTAVDISAPRYSPYSLRFGQEVSYDGKFAFRFGFDGSEPTVGVGATWRLVCVDYAYRSEDLGSNHRISVAVRFGTSLDQQRRANRTALEAEMDRQINSKLSDLESSQLSATLARADRLFGQERYQEAAGQYELALVWDENNDHAKNQVRICRFHDELDHAKELIERGGYLEALYHLRTALDFSPEDAEAKRLLTDCNRRIQEQADHTDMINGMIKRSIDLYASRQFVEARAGFREVLRLEPENSLAREYERKAHTNIRNQKESLVMEAEALAERGLYDAAISKLESAVRLTPDDGSLTTRIGELKREKQKKVRPATEKAAEKPVAEAADQERETQYDPAILDPKYNEGLRYFEQGRYEEAVRRFHEVWVVAPDYHSVSDLLTKTYLFMGMQEYSVENYREAIIIWEKALTVDPDNPKARRYLLKAREEASRLSKVENG